MAGLKWALAASVGSSALLVASAAVAGQSGTPYVDQLGGGAGGRHVQQVGRGPDHFGSFNSFGSDGHDGGGWSSGGGDDHHGSSDNDQHSSNHDDRDDHSGHDGQDDSAWDGHSGVPGFPDYDHDGGHGGSGSNLLVQIGLGGIQVVRFDDGTHVLQEHGNGSGATMTVTSGSRNLVGVAQLGSDEALRNTVSGDKNVLLASQGLTLGLGFGSGGHGDSGGTPDCWGPDGPPPLFGSDWPSAGGGGGNDIEAMQSGEANFILVAQGGSDNLATASQSGSGNELSIAQGGGAAGAPSSHNLVSAQQSGTGNVISAQQFGSGNRLVALQR
jgi:hypothetical protein